MGIAKDGQWLVGGDPLRALAEAAGVKLALPHPAPTFGSGGSGGSGGSATGLSRVATAGGLPAATAAGLDVVFPVLHGTYGEDGTIQGLLELADLPYVGAGVLASAVGMDKATMKAVFRTHGLPIVADLVVRDPSGAEGAAGLAAGVAEELGFPCFVKPANLGSSRRHQQGARAPPALAAAVDEALPATIRKIARRARRSTAAELEVQRARQRPARGVGPRRARCPRKEFYDYEDKYVDGHRHADHPRAISPRRSPRAPALAVAAFRAVDCSRPRARRLLPRRRTTGSW